MTSGPVFCSFPRSTSKTDQRSYTDGENLRIVEKGKRRMLRVSEDGNRRRDKSAANYGQLRQSLIDLQAAADRIFDTISERTAKEQEKLSDLSTRIHKAKCKINAISRSKESVAVRSCARYPLNFNGEDFRPLFGYNDGDTGPGFPVAKLSLNGGLNRESGEDGTLELYKFFSETCEFLPMEVHSEEGDHSKCTTFSKQVVSTPIFSVSGSLTEDHTRMDSLQNPKHRSLPPPPPSLLKHNLHREK